ncbi:hypothetical protein SISSUDRAFT_995313 [Sistotremastrum suecicum HHB10207 ss-3]|uniref:Uncharacterized protein n=1 Tax=Sistotremastrum suecicum HHB10207 ss-3 TaxID=1314776 RepID=A0A165WL64_9AGAM|nr:hypothetical protein SISSUDRAFT_995313 [Sistotremastrum suecicum HHB10207 ss-3]
MHLPTLNTPDLFIGLWKTTFASDGEERKHWPWGVFRDAKVWSDHGQKVADITSYLPGSFDRPPRNPAEKANSGYKAWEWLLYFFGAGPCLYTNVLPEKFYKHFALGVSAYKAIMQNKISVESLTAIEEKFLLWVKMFEGIYYKGRVSRLHFCRACMHTPIHLAAQVQLKGPLSLHSQWCLERTIGNLGEEIHLHSDPFTNLANIAVRRCQLIAVKTILPHLDVCDEQVDGVKVPQAGRRLDDGYVLLPKRDDPMQKLEKPHEDLLYSFFSLNGITSPRIKDRANFKVRRWSTLRLPNGQIARSTMNEKPTPKRTRKSPLPPLAFIRNGIVNIGEVQYFIGAELDKDTALALVSVYGPPNPHLMTLSHNTYWSAEYRGDTALEFIEVRYINSVVAMAPDPQFRITFPNDITGNRRFFLMEKPGLEVWNTLTFDSEEPQNQILDIGR